MRRLLSSLFSAVAAKRLSAVEVDLERSHQREFNGVEPLQLLLGPEEFADEEVLFVRRDDEGRAPLVSKIYVKWYDAREQHPTRTEWRLYFSDNEVVRRARAGDLLVAARRASGGLCLLTAPAGSRRERQLLALFDLKGRISAGRFEHRSFGENGGPPLDAAAEEILRDFGIIPFVAEEARLERLIADAYPESSFRDKFPSAGKFSKFARGTLDGIRPLEEPDGALLAWMKREEALFRTLERRLVSRRLEEGFRASDGTEDVDAFLSLSLSVQNRRKSRAGLALENHLEAMLIAQGLRFERNAKTEGNRKPDFLFPGGKEYRDPGFPAARLSMLGAKTTCKERWRQVLAEAKRIEKKHLLTLDPGVTGEQLNEMQEEGLRLVVPLGRHAGYKQPVRKRLMSLDDFVRHARERQSAS